MKISVVISAYNEEEMIGDCLESVKDLADEIIFVDNTSQDQTQNLAKKYTSKVFIRPNDPVNLNKNKNFGFFMGCLKKQSEIISSPRQSKKELRDTICYHCSSDESTTLYSGASWAGQEKNLGSWYCTPISF